MRKSKEILKKLAKLEHLVEHPAKYKKGDRAFYAVGEWLDYYAVIPDKLIEVEILDVRLQFDHEFAKKYYYRWEYYILTGWDKYNYIYCHLFTEEQVRKFKNSKISLPIKSVSVDEYFKKVKS